MPHYLHMPITTDAQLANPFETWCDTNGLHPDAPGAWAAFQHATEDPTAAGGRDPRNGTNL